MAAAEKFILVQPDPSAASERGLKALETLLAQHEFTYWQGIGDPERLLGMAQRKADSQTAGPEVRIPTDDFAGCLWRLALVKAFNPAHLETGPVANFVLRQLEPGAGKGLVPAILDQAALILKDSDCLGFSLFQVDGSSTALLGITTWPDVEAFDAYAGWAKNHPWKDTIGPQTIDVPLRLLAVMLARDGPQAL